MFRTFLIFVGFVTMLGAGVAVAAWPRATVMATGFENDEGLMRAFTRIHTGMPASQLGTVGFDIAKAQHLSKLALMERFMPKDSTAFDALDPAVQTCYVGPADCNAYIFTAMGAQAVLLVDGGRVTWKALTGVNVAGRHKGRVASRRVRPHVVMG
jgi:hypothetical protein